MYFYWILDNPTIQINLRKLLRMKNKAGLLICFILLSSILTAQQINYSEAKFRDVKKIAAKEGKLVFVNLGDSAHVATDLIESKVLNQPNIVKLVNEKFIGFREKVTQEEGYELYLKYKVKNLPAFLLVDSMGVLIHSFSGYQPTDVFEDELKVATTEGYSATKASSFWKNIPSRDISSREDSLLKENVKFAEYFEFFKTGELDNSGLLTYIKLREENGLDAKLEKKSIASGFSDEMFEEFENYMLAVESVDEISDPVFKKVLNFYPQKKQIKKLAKTGQSEKVGEVDLAIESLFEKAIQKAADSGDPNSIRRIMSMKETYLMKKNAKVEQRVVAWEKDKARLVFLHESADTVKLKAAISSYAKSYIFVDTLSFNVKPEIEPVVITSKGMAAEELGYLANALIDVHDSDEELNQAMDWLSWSGNIIEHPDFNAGKAKIYFARGDSGKAMIEISEGMTLCKTKGYDSTKIFALLKESNESAKKQRIEQAKKNN